MVYRMDIQKAYYIMRIMQNTVVKKNVKGNTNQPHVSHFIHF